MPLASILIPTFNRSTLIAKAINAAQNQTITDIEIIVVDNCSTDGTFESASSISNHDSRVKVYRNDLNLGPVKNWKRCIQLATSPFSKLLFSDDLIAPNFLERTLPKLFTNNTAFVYTPVICGDNEWQGPLLYRAFLNDCNFARDFYLRTAIAVDHFSPVSPGAALFRTKDLEENLLEELPGISGFDFRGTGAGVDWLIYLLTALRYQHVSYIDEPLCYFKAHCGSISANPSVHTGYAVAKQWLKNQVKGL